MGSIFDKRLLVTSGKGGVGKTTVSSALAVAAARQGKNVCIVEVGAVENIAPLFGKKRKAGYKGLKVWGKPGKKRSGGKSGSVHAFRLDPESSLREFVVRQVRVETIYKAVFNNRVMRYFRAAAPGLEDLLMLGKLVYMADEDKWDLVILDAPATGHGLAFFRSPFAFLQIAKVGPMRTRVERVWKFLQDEERTAVNIVALPEEMPVNESIELSKKLDEDLDLPVGMTIANAVFPNLFSKAEQQMYDSIKTREQTDEVALALIAAAEAEQRRAELHKTYVQRLKDEIDRPLHSLPYLFKPGFGVREVERLADHLGDV